VFKEGPGSLPLKHCVRVSRSPSHIHSVQRRARLSFSLSRYVSISLSHEHVHTVFTEGPDGMLVMAEWARKENEEV
jgi:hypothetical protein